MLNETSAEALGPPSPRCVVAIPARNEEDHVEACIAALAAQDGARLDAIVLVANNCADRTASAAASVRLPPHTRLHVLERTFAPEHVSAGHARRVAMDAAARLAGPAGVVLTTDADGQVDPDWLSANLDAMARGADAVAGWVELHPLDWGRIPNRLHEDDARECAYDALCDEIHARLDPDPHDPMPRHTQHSGASLAVTVAAYERCGGLPQVATGEDRALIARLRRFDARVRHAPEVHVTVSGRTEGRAAGGMADTIRRRMEMPDDLLDDRLEPAASCARRARCRAALRQAFTHGSADLRPVCDALGLPQASLATILSARYFGEAWHAAETVSPRLRPARVAVRDLPREMAAAEAIVAALRGSPIERFSPAGRAIAGEVQA